MYMPQKQIIVESQEQRFYDIQDDIRHFALMALMKRLKERGINPTGI